MTEIERATGLEQPMPPGEQVLWQAKPSPPAFTRAVFRLRALSIYCALAALTVAWLVARDRPIGQAIASATLLLPIFALGWGLLAIVGRVSARATTYTLTNRRVILHIGVGYEMTISVPLSAVTDASLRGTGHDTGEIALRVRDTGGVGYVALWPHARFGHFLRPQPMLRGLTDVETVAARFGEALVDFNAGGRARAAATLLTPAVAA